MEQFTWYCNSLVTVRDQQSRQHTTELRHITCLDRISAE